jgi:hypothetical protein
MTATTRRHTILTSALPAPFSASSLLSPVFASIAKQSSAGKAIGWIASPYGLAMTVVPAMTPTGTPLSLPSLALTYKNLPVIFYLLSLISYTLSSTLHRLAFTHNITPHSSLLTILLACSQGRLATALRWSSPPPPAAKFVQKDIYGFPLKTGVFTRFNRLNE